MKGFTEESLRKAQTELTDEFGVTTENMMFNIEADRLYCLLNAPNKEAVENTTTNMVSNANGYGNKNNYLNNLSLLLVL